MVKLQQWLKPKCFYYNRFPKEYGIISKLLPILKQCIGDLLNSQTIWEESTN
jgi:hypothetical protein